MARRAARQFCAIGAPAVFLCLALSGAALGAAPGAAIAASVAPPRPVAPFSVDATDTSDGSAAIATVDRACPTFSWSSMPGATSYRLDVTRVDGGERLALQVALPGGTVSWTPDARRCLTPGGEYTWTIRATTIDGALEPSAPARFIVRLAVTPELVEAVSEAVSGDLRATGALPTAGAAPLGSQDSLETAAGTQVRTPPVDSSFRGDALAPAGESYGLVGFAHASGGVGVGAANLAGGADLVLDGSAAGAVDARLDQDSLDRPSATLQTFDFVNTASSQMKLTLDGVPVRTQGNGGAGSSHIASHLDGIPAVSFSSDFHQHYERYQPKSHLTAPAVVADVAWDALTAVPADLADGDQAGYPVRYAKTTAGFSQVGDVAVAKGLDGLPVVAIKHGQNLNVFFCNQPECTSRTTPTTSPVIGVGDDLDIVITGTPESWRAVVAYESGGSVHVMACDRIACTNQGWSMGGTQPTFLRRVGPNPLIAVIGGANQIVLRSCQSATCSSIASVTLPGAASDYDVEAGSRLEFIVFPNGNPAIVYRTPSQLRRTYFCNSTCGGSAGQAFETSPDIGGYLADVAISQDGGFALAHKKDDLVISNCHSWACNGQTEVVVSSTGFEPTILLSPDGVPALTYFEDSDNKVWFTRCTTVDCTAIYGATPIGTGRSSGWSDTAAIIGGDGLPFIVYSGDATVEWVHCSDRFCTPYGMH